MKLKLIQRPDESEAKPVQMYAKTGEIRLRDVSPTQLKNKHLRTKNYGRWYVQPQNFNNVMKMVPDLEYVD